MYRDDLIERDMKWIKSVNPKGQTLESWMRENNYTGDETLGGEALLKIIEDTRGSRVSLNHEVISKL